MVLEEAIDYFVLGQYDLHSADKTNVHLLAPDYPTFEHNCYFYHI